MDYAAYIASDQWRRLRLLALERDGHACRLCPSTADLEVHHRCYPANNQWHLDRVENLTTLCSRCHFEVTNFQRERRYAVLIHQAGDVVRITPAVKVINERIQNPEISDYQRMSFTHAQWPDRRSAEPPLSEHRRNYRKEEKDRV